MFLCLKRLDVKALKQLNSIIIINQGLEGKLLALCEFPANQKWKLLYRGSRDGFSAKAFHSKCDYKANTLTIIKVSK
jgi:hypothetical protein